MVYGKILPGVFLARPNRFIAHVEVGGQTEVCHVKNTGRCRELLLPGVRVWLEESANPARKTKYDLIAVEKEREGGPLLINMDAQAPNKVFGEWAAAGGLGFVPTLLRPEMTYGNSRLDYYWELSKEGETRRGFWEIKGVTLEEGGAARFPDAPTLRGVKHLEEFFRFLTILPLRTCRKEAFHWNYTTRWEKERPLPPEAEAACPSTGLR